MFLLFRYKEVNTRLRKLLAEERRSMLQVRANYQNEINSRTELEMLLRDCVEEVRKEAERRYACMYIFLFLSSMLVLGINFRFFPPCLHSTFMILYLILFLTQTHGVC